MQEIGETRLCSVVSREAGDDPAGSAGSFRTALLIEVPPPWPRDASASKNFPAGLREALSTYDRADAYQKLVAFMPEEDRSVPGYTRLFRYSRPEAELFSRYDKAEYLVPTDTLPEAVDAIFSGSGEFSVGDHRNTRELFVCVHNNRDVCCGRFGTELHRTLKTLESEELRVWRCSHLGGHRFAPTMLDFPTGVVWGHLDPDSAAALVSRELPASEAGRFFRGWSGMKGQHAQLADRELLAQRGWSWLDAPRSATTAPRRPGSENYRIEISTLNTTLTATVTPTGSVMTLPSSGTAPLEEVTQYGVSELTETPKP